MIRKLRAKFVVINMVIVTVMIGVIFGLIWHFTKANLENESLHMMESLAENPFQLGLPDEQGEDVRLPYFTLQISVTGDLIATGGGYYDLSDRDFLLNLIRAVAEQETQTGVLPDYNLRFYRTVTPLTQCIVFADMSSELRTLEALEKGCLLVGLAALLVFLGVSVLLARWAVHPVERAWQQQRQFVADASHELKTPLTVIMTNAELLQGGADEEDGQTQPAGRILTMARQMRTLVEDLLELARADSGQKSAVFQRLDFTGVVRDALLPFEPVFFEKGLTLESALDDGIAVSGDAAGLGQVVEILLDNAQKYSAPGGRTVVRLRRQGHSRCVLSVANDGAPIAPEDLQNIFKRFYRVDKARSRTGSFGLGLSIAKTVVEKHRGKIWAESSGGVNTFFVQLPAVH